MRKGKIAIIALLLVLTACDYKQIATSYTENIRFHIINTVEDKFHNIKIIWNLKDKVLKTINEENMNYDEELIAFSLNKKLIPVDVETSDMNVVLTIIDNDNKEHSIIINDIKLNENNEYELVYDNNEFVLKEKQN